MTGQPWELIVGAAGFIALMLLLVVRGGKGG
jgi:hypothetical protein